MSIAKVIEVIAESDKGWEDAAENAIEEVTKSVKNVRSLYVKDMQAVVKDGKIKKWRLNANVTFVVDSDDD